MSHAMSQSSFFCLSQPMDGVRGSPWVSEFYQSLTAHQHQKGHHGHTVPKQVIMIALSIQVATV